MTRDGGTGRDRGTVCSPCTSAYVDRPHAVQGRYVDADLFFALGLGGSFHVDVPALAIDTPTGRFPAESLHGCAHTRVLILRRLAGLYVQDLPDVERANLAAAIAERLGE